MNDRSPGLQLDPAKPLVEERLRLEVEFFYRRIFDSPLPEEVREKYVAANLMLCNSRVNLSAIRLDLIMQRSLDVEALEFVLRRRNPQNILTIKLLIIHYLTEARSSYFDFFVNESNRPVSAFAELTFHCFRSLYKLAKGRYLLWRYNVV